MPGEFHKMGIRFLYPENWTLDEEDALGGQKSVAVYSPGGAFWSVSVHPRHANPAQLAEAAVKAMQEEYEELESEEEREVIEGRELVGFDLNFYYLDLTNTATVRVLQTPHATYVIFCQAEDREFDQIQRVFQAITTSFVKHLPDA